MHRPTPQHRSLATERQTRARGFALLDALVALALVGLIALGSAGLLTLAHGRLGEARRLRDATVFSQGVLADLVSRGWHALPPAFGADQSAATASLDSARGELPRALEDELDALGLSGKRLVLRLSGLGPGGAGERFDRSVALLVEAELTWDEGARRRRVRLFEGRF